MKIRIGFVSNSSSSSFCIYGVCLNNSEIKEMIENKDNKDLEDLLYEITAKEGLYYYGDEYDYYIGLSWSDVEDNETGKQFKERTKEKISKILKGNLQLGTYEEVYPN